jgi:hypothetical protein
VLRALSDADLAAPDEAQLSVLVGLVRSLGERKRSTVSPVELAQLLDVVS